MFSYERGTPVVLFSLLRLHTLIALARLLAVLPFLLHDLPLATLHHVIESLGFRVWGSGFRV